MAVVVPLLSTLPPTRCWAAVATPKLFLFFFRFFCLFAVFASFPPLPFLFSEASPAGFWFTSLANTPKSEREGNSLLFLAQVKFFFFFYLLSQTLYLFTFFFKPGKREANQKLLRFRYVINTQIDPTPRNTWVKQEENRHCYGRPFLHSSKIHFFGTAIIYVGTIAARSPTGPNYLQTPL